jgi:glycosyltransferase involved in cell wall biosynthesis
MRLAIHTQYYPPEMGAPQARLSELAARFVARGHEVFVLTAMPNYPLGRVYDGYGGWFCRERLAGTHLIRTYVYPTKSVSMVPRLWNYFSFVFSSLGLGALTLPKVDYLLTENPPLFLGISGYGLSRLKRARWIFNVSDLWPESAVHLGIVKDGLALRLSYALEAFCYRKAWLVTGQSRGILSNIEKRFPKVPCQLLTNGVDPEFFHPDLEPRREHFGLRGTCVAVYTGLHGIAQGLDQLLEAAHRLRDMEGLVIYLIGDGPEKEALQRRARELELSNLHFLDPLPRAEMPSLMASADIAIACLKQTLPGAVPSKIYEAMGAARPLLLVGDGEPAEILRETGAGLAVAPGDLDSLEAAFRTLAKDPAKRQELGAAGRRAAETRFNRWRIVDTLIDRLEEGLQC